MIDTYREEILEHWKNPLNFGQIKNADIVIEQINPLCGDQLTFYFKIKGKRVERVMFEGSGCAISIATASLLSESIKGKKIEELEKITGHDVLGLIGGSIAPARIKCAFLSLEALKKLSNK